MIEWICSYSGQLMKGVRRVVSLGLFGSLQKLTVVVGVPCKVNFYSEKYLYNNKLNCKTETRREGAFCLKGTSERDI